MRSTGIYDGSFNRIPRIMRIGRTVVTTCWRQPSQAFSGFQPQKIGFRMAAHQLITSMDYPLNPQNPVETSVIDASRSE